MGTLLDVDWQHDTSGTWSELVLWKNSIWYWTKPNGILSMGISGCRDRLSGGYMTSASFNTILGLFAPCSLTIALVDELTNVLTLWFSPFFVASMQYSASVMVSRGSNVSAWSAKHRAKSSCSFWDRGFNSSVARVMRSLLDRWEMSGRFAGMFLIKYWKPYVSKTSLSGCFERWFTTLDLTADPEWG